MTHWRIDADGSGFGNSLPSLKDFGISDTDAYGLAIIILVSVVVGTLIICVIMARKNRNRWKR
jgi:hypothetical protein